MTLTDSAVGAQTGASSVTGGSAVNLRRMTCTPDTQAVQRTEGETRWRYVMPDSRW
jgi:hypothetical protein